jgi:hypothetical protein
MPDTTGPLSRAQELAAHILRERLGPDIQLGAPQLIKDESRAIVARAELRGSAARRSVIIKVIRDDPATGFSEWAALAFLAGLPDARDLAPGFLGGDVAERLFLMEDLGPGHTLGDLLAGGARAEAAAALRRLAKQMARLHAATLGQEPGFLRQRLALPAAEGLGRRQEAQRWLAGRDRVIAWLDAAGCATPAGLDACQAQIAATYADPDGWLSFTHGDPAPSNNHIASADVRLVDFEYGAFRHALYDISGWEMLCPLPRPYVKLMLQDFQATLAEALPAAGDAGAFERAWATICAYRGLALLSWVPPALLKADRPMVGDWSAREAVLAAASRTALAAAGAPELAPVASAADRLHEALRARWPELAGRDDIATRWAALEDRG